MFAYMIFSVWHLTRFSLNLKLLNLPIVFFSNDSDLLAKTWLLFINDKITKFKQTKINFIPFNKQTIRLKSLKIIKKYFC